VDWSYNTIWFDQIESSKFKHVKDAGLSFIIENNSEIQYLVAQKYRPKSKDLSEMQSLENLVYLNLIQSNIESLKGIGKFRNLKRLELNYCLKLSSELGIDDLADSLEILYIEQSKKLSLGTNIEKLKKLRVLCFNDCGPIESLEFIRDLPKLIDVRFVNTNILDGNLNPAISHPTLKNCGYLNKRHYNIDCEEMKVILANKNTRTEKTYVNKGEYRTFKYEEI